jgi:hypothetical protein
MKITHCQHGWTLLIGPVALHFGLLARVLGRVTLW